MYLYTYIHTTHTETEKDSIFFILFHSAWYFQDLSTLLTNIFSIKVVLQWNLDVTLECLKASLPQLTLYGFHKHISLYYPNKASYLKNFPLSLLHQYLPFSQVLNLCCSIPDKVCYLRKDHLEVMSQLRLVTILM